MINRQKLSAALEEYKKDFDSEWEDEKYKWQAVKCFQDNWDIHAVDFVAMLAKSLKKTANLLTSNIGESVRNGRLHRLRDSLKKSQRIILGKM